MLKKIYMNDRNFVKAFAIIFIIFISITYIISKIYDDDLTLPTLVATTFGVIGTLIAVFFSNVQGAKVVDLEKRNKIINNQIEVMKLIFKLDTDINSLKNISFTSKEIIIAQSDILLDDINRIECYIFMIENEKTKKYITERLEYLRKLVCCLKYNDNLDTEKEKRELEELKSNKNGLSDEQIHANYYASNILAEMLNIQQIIESLKNDLNNLYNEYKNI